jgi:D-serine deaminase-like pyridoxal phosphate-dependent protein
LISLASKQDYFEFLEFFFKKTFDRVLYLRSPMQIDQIPTPALLLDADVLEQNLQKMQNLADLNHVALRPHIKTHKCFEIAHQQKLLGAVGITVSTLYEAKVFAADGFDDITWALPLPLSRLPEALELAQQITLRLVIDSEEALSAIIRACRESHFSKTESEAKTKTNAKANVKIHIWLKIDCGYHRAGIDPESPLVESLVKKMFVTSGIVFDGILTHAGHSYHAQSVAEIRAIAHQEKSVMIGLAHRLRALPDLATGRSASTFGISIGSTPTLSLCENGLSGIDEIRPGNYAFYDYTQVALGSCAVKDCALTVLASVVSAQQKAGHCLIDAGALALSKDAGPTHLSSEAGMGRAKIFNDYSTHSFYLNSERRVESLSQEVGKIIIPTSKMSTVKVGQKMRLLEHHSCLTAAQFDFYYVCRGNEVIDQWRIWRGRD